MAGVPALKYLMIPTKPNAPITYSLWPGSGDPDSAKKSGRLIVFINGLLLPAAAWNPTIQMIQTSGHLYPPMLTYDRFGQGFTTSRDPLDKTKGSHDFMDGRYQVFIHQQSSAVASPESMVVGTMRVQEVLFAGDPNTTLFAWLSF